MGHQRQVHYLLYGGGAYLGVSGLPYGHDVGMISEYGKDLHGKRTGRNMENRRHEFAGYLVHIGQHQHQSLGSGERRCERTGRQ